MAHHGRVVGQTDVFGLVGAAGQGGAVGGARLLVDDEGALDIDLDGAGMGDGAVYFGRVGQLGMRQRVEERLVGRHGSGMGLAARGSRRRSSTEAFRCQMEIWEAGAEEAADRQKEE